MAKHKAKSELYKNVTTGEWRWVTQKNGLIIGASTEGYKRRHGALKNYDMLVGVDRIDLFDPKGVQIIKV